MLLLIVLALLGLGALLGAAGMKRLGRWTSAAAGRWRPGVGVGALILAFSGMALAAKGAWLFGLPLLAGGAGLAVTARKRSARVEAVFAGMSEAEARSVLGVGPQADRADIQAAYLRLMQLAHPDRGGTSGLASQLNAARARLLG